jgi:ribonuclease J
MNLTIHRGTHEIGGSCVEITSGSSRIIIDIGMPLVNSDGEKFSLENYAALSGEELVSKKVLPDVKGIYKWDKQNKKIDGILISHPHMDHYGFLNYLREDTNYYIGESAKKIIDMTCVFTSMKGTINNFTPLESGKALIIGDFKVTPYLMDHSAYDAYAFLIEADGRRIIYSGDFREHGRKGNALKYFLNAVPKNVDTLILEGTMFGRQQEVIKTEQELEEEIDVLVKRTKGITLMNFSAQNIDRVVTMYRVAKRNNKIFVIDFYAANVLSLLRKTIPHPSSDFPEVRVFYPTRLSDKTAREGHRDLMFKFGKFKITKQEINEKGKDVMMLVRGSMLNDLRYINVEHGLFIYSMWEGYLKEKSMESMLDFVNENKINFKSIHTSGHASINTLNKVTNIINPKVVIPIHSFYPEEYKQISTNIKILSDGEVYNV